MPLMLSKSCNPNQLSRSRKLKIAMHAIAGLTPVPGQITESSLLGMCIRLRDSQGALANAHGVQLAKVGCPFRHCKQRIEGEAHTGVMFLPCQVA